MYHYSKWFNNITISATNRPTDLKKKITKCVELNNTIGTFDMMNLHRTPHSSIGKYTFFWNTQKMYEKWLWGKLGQEGPVSDILYSLIMVQRS